MNEILTPPASQSEAGEKNTLRQIIAELERINARAAEERKEIDRLKADSDQLKLETRSILTSLGVGV